MKIIQIRGSNGCGKTSVVRTFINANNWACSKIKVGKRDVDITIVNKNIVIIGRYDQNECGGCDSSIKTSEELKNTIAKLARTYNTIVFEGVMYGSYVFTLEIYKLAKAIGAEFVAVCCEPPLEISLQRIYARNGGKEINVKSLISKYNTFVRGNRKLQKSGVYVRIYDTSAYAYEDMKEILEETI